VVLNREWLPSTSNLAILDEKPDALLAIGFIVFRQKQNFESCHRKMWQDSKLLATGKPERCCEKHEVSLRNTSKQADAHLGACDSKKQTAIVP